MLNLMSGHCHFLYLDRRRKARHWSPSLPLCWLSFFLLSLLHPKRSHASSDLGHTCLARNTDRVYSPVLQVTSPSQFLINHELARPLLTSDGEGGVGLAVPWIGTFDRNSGKKKKKKREKALGSVSNLKPSYISVF